MTTPTACTLSACFTAFCATIGTACGVTSSADPLWWFAPVLLIVTWRLA